MRYFRLQISHQELHMDDPRPVGATSENLNKAGIGTIAQPPVAGATDIGAAPAVPGYLQDIYHWAYLNPRNAWFLDREIIVKAILWGQHGRLRQAAFAEIKPGQDVLQAACVYGQFSRALAEHIGTDGRLEIVDVALVQVGNCRRKLKDYPNTEVRHQNVMHLRDYSVDVACSYFLLHEVPDDCKTETSAALLNSVRIGGKVVFVDYHKPHWAHPLKYFTSLVFDSLEPYAKGLWRQEIAAYAANDPRFSWDKEIFFGGLYQKVVATRIA